MVPTQLMLHDVKKAFGKSMGNSQSLGIIAHLIFLLEYSQMTDVPFDQVYHGMAGNA